MIAAYAIFTAVCISGCSDDPAGPGLPQTQEELIEDLALAYGQMDSTAYAALLHEDFAFLFFAGRQVDPLIWDRDQELAGAGRMFRGLPPIDAQWNPYQGVESIPQVTLARQTEWAVSPVDDPHFPGVSWAEYAYDVTVLLEGGDLTLRATGLTTLYAVEDDDGWQLAGQGDLGGEKRSSEDLDWSTLKWIYRAGDVVTGPATPDEVMVDFERAYTQMDIDAYDSVLDEGFIFAFIDYDRIWYKAEDMNSTGNMFSGEPGTNPDWSYREGVQSISFYTLIRQTPWETVPPEDPYYPDTERALYQVLIVFTLIGGENTMTVSCDQIFYVKAEEILQGDGSTRPLYSLAGQLDLPGHGKANEDMTWGHVKSLYYSNE